MKFFDEVKTNIEYTDGLVHCVTSDILDHSEFWSEETSDFLEVFEEALKSKGGREFILFLVGMPNINEYLNYLSETLGMEVPDTDND